MRLFALAIITMFISGALTFGFKQFFGEKLLDIPNNRSSHLTATPRGGGLGFIIAFGLITLFLYGAQNYISVGLVNSFGLNLPKLWLVLLPLIVVGILDDRYQLSVRIRYLVHLVVAMGAFWQLELNPIPIPMLMDGGLIGHGLILVINIIGFTALINFYNFIDGIDGLIASVTAVQISFIAYYLHQPLWYLLAAALAGFLLWNWAPAKIFMGDVGSTFLGAMVAIAILNNPAPQTHPPLALLVVTLPITGDAVYTIISRLIRRENIFMAHCRHIFYRLYKSGWSHPQITLCYASFSILCLTLIKVGAVVGSIISLGLIILAIAGGEWYLARCHQTASESQSKKCINILPP
ncbi:MAG: glycosyltransferase family 4 protein, partial [Synechococcaceae cyanobacterium RL_1_2]|nr:glycosyltransferase family 4 protein [Synechococcaceae cyanobacterium RL_1_2]